MTIQITAAPWFPMTKEQYMEMDSSDLKTDGPWSQSDPPEVDLPSNPHQVGQLKSDSEVSEPASPNNKLIYLAGPRDSITLDQANGWRREAIIRLRWLGFATFSPVVAFDNVTRAMGSIVDEVNRTAIRESAGVLVYIEKGQETVGTWREVEYAIGLDKKVYVVAKHLMDHILTYDVMMFPQLVAAVAAIDQNHRPGSRRAYFDVPGLGEIHVRPISKEKRDEYLRLHNEARHYEHMTMDSGGASS